MKDQVEEWRWHNRQGHASIVAANQYYIPLVVKVHKKATSWLEISCRSYPDELAIESLAFGPREESVDSSDVEAKIRWALMLESLYCGVFSFYSSTDHGLITYILLHNLSDEEFQQAFHSYTWKVEPFHQMLPTSWLGWENLRVWLKE